MTIELLQERAQMVLGRKVNITGIMGAFLKTHHPTLGDSRKKAEWDAQYRQGKFDFLYSIDQIGHYMIIVGYLPYLHEYPRILDVGCGEGRLFELLTRTTFQHYLGIDLSKEAIQRAKQLSQENARFEVANFENWRPPGKFDIIIFNESLYYTDRPRTVFRRFARCLISGGTMILSVHRYFDNEKIWEQIPSEYDLLASDTVTNKNGETWDVRAIRPYPPNRFLTQIRRISGKAKKSIHKDPSSPASQFKEPS